MNAINTDSDYPASLAALARIVEDSDGGGLASDWLEVVQEVAGVGIWDWRSGQTAAMCTESNARLYGLPRAKVMPPHEQWLSLIHPEDRPRVANEFESAVLGTRSFQTEFRVVWPDGTVHWLAGKGRSFCDPTGKPTRLVGVNYDVTAIREAEQASLRAAEERRHQARHDLLTGLPNRRFIESHLRQAMLTAAECGHMLAVLYIDLDGFKVVNDTLGHSVGDDLLREVSSRLKQCVMTDGTIARTGGDEFTLLLPAIANREAAAEIANRIILALKERFRVGPHTLYVTASAGISIFPEDAREAGALQQNADIAMYSAKRASRNTFRFFSPDMIEPLRERLLLETALRGALERGDLSIAYQPIFEIGNDAAAPSSAGFEALLRWTDPGLGPVSPARFIPIAEDTGMIVPIGTWVLREVCRQIRKWGETARVFVNVSTLQFASHDFVAIVAGILESERVAGTSLGIEITESVLMTDVDACARKVRDLQALGVSVSIDDFGTGYSCLSYLRRIPIDTLKIDGSFVRDVGVKPEAAALIGGIVALAHNLGMRVVAECIENETQLDAMRVAGCDLVQGYLLGRPASVNISAAPAYSTGE